MIIKQTTIYQCQYCKKVYLRKHFAELHEESCVWNPLNHRDCYVCRYMVRKKVTFGELHDQAIPYCSKHQHFLIPPIVEKKLKRKEQEPYKLGKMNIPMPTKCEAFIGEDFFPLNFKL